MPPTAAPTPFEQRFDRLARLYGHAALSCFAGARIAVFGVGGVGSFAAETLARSAIGHLLLVDLDHVCITNTNRQLQAVDGAAGVLKAVALRDRLRLVNPDARIDALAAAYEEGRALELLAPPWPGPGFDFVVDCIDAVSAKAHLIAACRRLAIPIVSSMGAAGKTDPTRIRVTDLAGTDVCRLAQQVRKMLRQRHGFPRGDAPMGVTAVYSDEPRRWPRAQPYDDDKGLCACGTRHGGAGPSRRNLVEGTAAFVTGAFGLACAAHVVGRLAARVPDAGPPAAAAARR